MNTPSISIVSAFFDIGRSDWTTEKGLPEYLERSNDKYFSYFAKLAKLDNHMVIFCEENHKDKILELRQGKSTEVVTLDFKNSFQSCRDKVISIQQDINFQQKIDPKQRNNPEYWSADYVLINNLKTYFINQAIKQNLIKDELVAWVDFGYCRDDDTLGKLTHWYYPFNKERVHMFILEPTHYFGTIPNFRFPNTVAKAQKAMFMNKPFIIGGVLVATQEKWQIFANIIKDCHHGLLKKNIIDDDQGIYLLCRAQHKSLIQLNYLTKIKRRKLNWFGVFKLYSK